MKNGLGIALMGGFLMASCQQQSPEQLSPEQINNFKTFKDWCVQQERLAPEAKHTVEALLKQADTKDCDRASKQLAAMTSLIFSGNQIVDLKPLSGLTQLTHLNLSKNLIVDLKPLSGLIKLTYFDLRESPIANKTCPLKPASICLF
jgi:internalin A